MQCFIVGLDRDEAHRGALVSLAERLGLASIAVPSLAVLRGDQRFRRATRPLVLVGHAAIDAVPPRDVAAFAQEQAQEGDAFTVYLADTIAPDAYKLLVRSGAAEWVRWQDAEAELRDLALRLRGPVIGDNAAKIVSFLPSKGGVGNTTLAVETAMCLAGKRKRGGGRVAILDLDLQGGTLADALDIEPRFDLAEIAGSPERLDEQLIDVFTSRHSPRLDVFASPARMTALDAVEPQIVFTFIDAISSRYDAILFDLPSYWLAWIDPLLQGSDAVVVSGGGTVPALRKLSARLGHLKDLGVPETRFAAVLVQADVDLLGRVARRAETERALAGHRTFFVRRDHASVGEAGDVGRPLMETAPGTRVARDIRRVAEWIEAAIERPAAVQPEKARKGAA